MKKYFRWGGEAGHWKVNKNEQGEGRPRFSNWSFIVILQFFLLIIMAVWNIKQTIVKDYNIQSCQWMACDRFGQPLLFCTTFCSSLCTVHYFLCAFTLKMATYSLVVDNVYFVISSSVCQCSEPYLETLEWKKLYIFFNLSVFWSFQ